MKKSFKLKDDNNNIAFIELEITHRNKYPELTIGAEINGHHGQSCDEIKPATKLQTSLIKLWKTKHLKKVSGAEQKIIQKLVRDLEVEYDEQRGTFELFKMDESDALDAVLEHNFSNPEKVLAVLIEEGATVEEIANVTEVGDNSFLFGGREFLVCTDNEANEAQDEEFENYIYECILPTIPENIKKYFDSESWKENAKNDGRGHCLNRYDGNEIRQSVNGTIYFLYRQ